MKRILFLTSELQWTGHLSLLLRTIQHLPGTDWDKTVLCVGSEGPAVNAYRATGVPVVCLGSRRRFDLQAPVSLRNQVRRLAPQVVHVLGWQALRWISLAGYSKAQKVVVSGLGHPPANAWWSRQLVRLLLRSASLLVVRSDGEAAAWRSFVQSERIAILPAAYVEERDSHLSATPAALGLPADARCMICVGPLERAKGHLDAIWAFDILRFLEPRLRLVFVGDGPDRPRLEQYAADLKVAPLVRFLGTVPAVRPILMAGEIFWGPSLVERGQTALLEAVAAGTPVVATHQQAAMTGLQDAVHVSLFPKGDKPALARQTRRFLDDRSLAERLATQARTLQALRALGDRIAPFQRYYSI